MKDFARIRRGLEKRFDAPAWALFFEVPDGTGRDSTRRADAVALSLYPSRGLEIHGCEVKVNRSDWLRELKKQAEKSAPVQRFCHRWWVVAPPGVVDVELDGLPPTWGLLELGTGGALRAKVKAPVLSPEPVSGSFVASLGRCMHTTVDNAKRAVRRELEAGDEYQRGLADGQALARKVFGNARAPVETIQATLKSFRRMVIQLECERDALVDPGGRAAALLMRGRSK